VAYHRGRSLDRSCSCCTLMTCYCLLKAMVYGLCRPSATLELQNIISTCIDDVARWMRSNRLQLNTPFATSVTHPSGYRPSHASFRCPQPRHLHGHLRRGFHRSRFGLVRNRNDFVKSGSVNRKRVYGSVCDQSEPSS